ncbi:serine/threonine-protein kinase PLK4-like [Homarus americanus]|uniref:Serine/threonine-protein kinase PLK4 n=1 Tax=Homarus americanus TaxID=6706 RepID=A0A8J5JP51_HOMAM|nr:serine/threonine-protein kinase PLK4-like [Homarus americanus]
MDLFLHIQINKSEITAGGLINRVRQEVTIHSRLCHPSILRLYTFFEDEQFVYLVLELCVKGELQKHLKDLRRVLTEDEAREYLGQIVAGMLYLHSQSIMHRDLTLSNILLDNHGRIKIADFGLATQLRRPDDRHTTMCGTPNYISPEVVTRSPHGLEADVWGLGCMLFIMLTGRPPFDSKGVKEVIFTNVVMGDYKIPSYVSANACALISECLQKNPKERIKLELIPHHPFMAIGNKADISRMSDSGLYTMTTVTTQHTRIPLTAISESELSCSGGSGNQTRQMVKPHIEPCLRHPPSPPVRMKSSPRDLLPPNAGIIDNLKRKFTPLPSMKGGGNLAFSTPSLPPLIKRERDVSEERRRQQQLSDQRCGSSSSCDEQSSSSQYAPSQVKEVSHHIPRERKDRVRSSSRSSSSELHRAEHDCVGGIHNPSKRERSIDRKNSFRDKSDISHGHSTDRNKNSSYDQYLGHQGQVSRATPRKTECDFRSRSLERKFFSDNLEKKGLENERLTGKQMKYVENYQTGSSKYEHISGSRERCESGEHLHSNTSKDRTRQQHRSRSLEKHRDDSKENCRNRLKEPEEHSSRNKAREHYRDKTHSCCQSSHHKSWCERRHRTLEQVDSVFTRGRYTENERQSNSNLDICSSHSRNLCNNDCKASAKSFSRGQSACASKNEQNNILNDISKVVHMSPVDCVNVNQKQLQASANPRQQPVTSKTLGVMSNQTLKQQVSPLSSIIIYQPNGGSGSLPGDAPLPLPDEGTPLIFSYENIPPKYWNKYKTAARFVNLVKSKTMKITHYTNQAKFLLMENSPDPDFVAMFYHGTKVTKTGNTVVLRESTGASHTVPQSTGCAVLPDSLQPFYRHFKQIHDHCLYLERVLSEVTAKTGIDCFPVILGSKPASIPASPPESARSKPHFTSQKENISPKSIHSYRAKNSTSQLGSYEGSTGSVQIMENPTRHVRTPLTPHTFSNIQVRPESIIKHPLPRVYVQNIGWASQGSNGEVSVEYLDGARVQVSSNSPKVIFTEASGVTTSYSANDKLPLVLQNKLSQMQTVLSSLSQSPSPNITPMSSNTVGLH